MPTSRPPNRTQHVIHLTLMLLLVISVFQVEWRFIDQRANATQTAEQFRDLYREHALAYDRLFQRGELTGEQIHAEFAFLEMQNGRIVVSPAALKALADDRAAQINEYAWQTGFFLVVLFCCIGVLARAAGNEMSIRRTQDTFLATVSHEFRTPLASLRLGLETLEMRHPGGQSEQQLMGRMNADLHRMELLVSNVLDASRLAGGQIYLTMERLHLASLVRDVVERARAAHQDAEFSIDIEVGDRLFVQGDAMALSTVIGNVVGNAIKAVRDSAEKRIRVTASERDGSVRLVVKDTGMGFPQEEADKLFDKFKRVDSHANLQHGGTGLGLFIARRLMEMSGSTIRARSAGPDRGARFTIVVPAAASEGTNDSSASSVVDAVPERGVHG